MRLSTRSSVDLPQPDGPMKAVTLSVVERQADVLQRLGVAVEEIEVRGIEMLLGQTAPSRRRARSAHGGEHHRRHPLSEQARAPRC